MKEAAPKSKQDLKLSIKHLKETQKFHKKHLKEHMNAAPTPYNKSHAKGHKQELRDAHRLLPQRIRQLKTAM